MRRPESRAEAVIDTSQKANRPAPDRILLCDRLQSGVLIGPMSRRVSNSRPGARMAPAPFNEVIDPMPEDKPHKRPPVEPDKQAADAGLLFRDSAAKSANPAQPAAGAAKSGAGEEFDLVDAPEWAADSAPPQVPSPPRARPQAPAKDEPRSEGNPAAAREARRAPAMPPPLPRSEGNPAAAREAAARQVAADPSDLVEETWSRWAEWGSNLLVVGGWMAVLLFLVYFVFGQEYYLLAFVLLFVGSGVAVVLSYPMLITLERPVRVTPEQAVRDYYTALSHHVPHLRRMWLLLSTAGRVSTAFGSFEGFKGYWREQLARLREGHAGPFTPLVFEIVNFSSEKSAGKARIDATFGLSISVRGKRAAGAIHNIPASISLVRGPDNMWYLDNGTLPRGQSAARSKAGGA